MENLEKVLVSRGERIVLQMLEKQYQWIARDENGSLYVYEDKPTKSIDNAFWYSHDGSCELCAFEHHFQFIQIENDEPWLIKDIINKCGVKF